MTTVETNAAKIDLPPEKSRAERTKFKLELALMVLMAGRTDESRELFQQAFDLLEEIIQEEINHA